MTNEHPGVSHRIATGDDREIATYLEIAQHAEARHPDTDSEEPPARDLIVVIDFGSQYSRLIARRIRELKVYCEVLPATTPWADIQRLRPKGFIFSGGPASVYEKDAPMAPAEVYEAGVPILGICYGMQLLAHQLGGDVENTTRREYGHSVLHRAATIADPLLEDLPPTMPVWMSHGDHVTTPPAGFRTLAFTDNSPIAAMVNDSGYYGIQFHPEVVHTPNGKQLLENFLLRVCKCEPTWTAANFVEATVAQIREQVGDGHAICALSGGVDSAVAAALVHRAIGDRLTCIFVNNGLLRKDEPERLRETFERNLHMNLIVSESTDRFLDRLEGITDPETKRKTIGEEFIWVFEEEAGKLGEVDFLVQGTTYPDVIESLTADNTASAVIKTHHNVGGLPEEMRLELVEPLRYLFKDEVRAVGSELGLPDEIVWRQPFPGPGLAIRILGEITREGLHTLREADAIVNEEIRNANLTRELWQSFAVLTASRTVGVQGDFRTYGNVIAIRAVTSEDAMTADWARLPYDLLARISSRIANEAPNVNRVVYDITSKPPGTIEWE